MVIHDRPCLVCHHHCHLSPPVMDMRDPEGRGEIPPVWAVGGNSKGQLGLGHASSCSSLPRSVPFHLAPHQRIVEVFCGYEHTFALTSDGDVLGFGNGIKGQLGIGNTDSHSSPQRVHLLCGKGVIKMAAGLEHSLALTDSGDLYSFGDNLSGQLGLGHNYTAKEQTPQKVLSLSKAKVTQMACGQDHTAVLTSSGELFCFGNNRFGALGLAGHDNEGPPIVASAPQLVSALKGKQVVQIGCGLQHTVALTGAGNVYCWGHNSRGQLGTGDTQNQYSPALVCKPLLGVKCIHVACGGQHTLVVTDHDDVYGFGSDRHGQLGLGQGGVIFPVPSRIVRLGGRRVKHAVGGAWHTVIRTDTGESYVMGCVWVNPNGPHTNAGHDGAAPAAETVDSVRHSSRSTSTGTPSPADPFALSFGGFRRLMLPRGAEACSKGHSIFYGRCLGAPTIALRKVVKSLGRLKVDISKMLVRQQPDVVFTSTTTTTDGHASVGNVTNRSAYGGHTDRGVGVHLAVLRARCPSLYKHAAAAIANEEGRKHKEGAEDQDTAWRVPSPPGVPIDALQLVVAYLYEDAGVFDKRKREAVGAVSSFADYTAPPQKSRFISKETPSAETSRARERRGQLFSMRSKVSGGGSSGEMAHELMDATMEAWDERGEGEDEAAAGFGSFGGAYGSYGSYDGSGLDRLMGLMAAARALKLVRLQGLCEKRAEAFVDCLTVHKVLRRAAEGGFPYLKRRCLEFCLTHLAEVCAPDNSTEVVRELGRHPQVLADLLSLSAASDGAKLAAAREMSFDGSGKIPCIELLRAEAPCAVLRESYQRDFLTLFETVVRGSVAESEQLQPLCEPDAAAAEIECAQSSPRAALDVRKRGGHPIKGKEASMCDAEERGVPVHPVGAEGDFRIRAGEGMPPVTVHRCILAARSGFFRALLEGTMGEARQGEMTLKFEPNVGMSGLLEFLRFLYTGRTGVMDPVTALDVLFLTKGDEGSGGFFQVAGNDELRAFCTSTLVEGVDADNALAILARAKALGDEATLETAISFLLTNFNACLRPAGDSNATGLAEEVAVPACLADDESPAVDLLLALAKRCTISVNSSS